MSLSTPNIIPEDSGLPKDDSYSGPKKSELPWHMRPWALLLLSIIYTVTLVVVLALVGHGSVYGPPWTAIASVFILGAVIGLIGVRAVIRLREANWPLTRLSQEITGGRFFSLKSPTFSAAYWRTFRRIHRGQAKKDGLLVILLMSASLLVGWLIGQLLKIPGGYMLHSITFFGCLLTLAGLSSYLWWRSLPD